MIGKKGWFASKLAVDLDETACAALEYVVCASLAIVLVSLNWPITAPGNRPSLKGNG